MATTKNKKNFSFGLHSFSSKSRPTILWAIYAGITTFFFIYFMPLLLVKGIGPLSQITEIENNLTFLQIKNVDDLAFWFANQESVRNWATVLLIAFMVLAEITVLKAEWREFIYYIIMWIAFLAFMISFEGLAGVLIAV